MQLADLLKEMLDEDSQDVWTNERTPTPVRWFGVRLHAAGLSIRETVAILDLLGIDCSHGAAWNWVHTLSEAQSDPPTADPAAVFLHRLTQKHDVAGTVLLIDAGGYLTAPLAPRFERLA